jgi:UDP-N-acetyl-2-amino-2-deoxyglucuronate dehydrogenase
LPKYFTLIGAAGYVAPRHMQAIKYTGNQLIAALDPNDSVGIIDSYFPECSFFTEFERFDRHIDKLRRKGNPIDYVSICSPNYLHDAHCRFGMRVGADVICEKPLVLNPWNIDALQQIEEETGKKIYNILQLRLHESVIELKRKVDEGPKDKVYDVDLTYITSRGKWYHISWKGDQHKSGGIATNIGVHFFDMLIWVFGQVKENIVHVHEDNRAAGYLQLEKARVRWFLSVDYQYVPDEAKQKGMRTFRSIKVDDDKFEFSGGFTELHNLSYQEILDGQGFGTEEVRPAIEVVHDIRKNSVTASSSTCHPFVNNR